MTTELENGNKTTERISTNRVDKAKNDIIQNPQGGMKDVQDVRNNTQRPKNSNLKAMANRQPKGKGA
jgi:hypothetical protein